LKNAAFERTEILWGDGKKHRRRRAPGNVTAHGQVFDERRFSRSAQPAGG
jgi:hypothetical protein